MAFAADVPLLDREAELQALDEVLHAARHGSGGALLVEGPPGIGKSSLVAAARAAAQDFRVVAARATALDRELPFGVVRQLLEPVLARATSVERRALLAGAGALAELVLSQSPTGDRRADDAATAFHGLYWFAANLAAQRPLLALVDDVHWADTPSLRWLLHLAPRIEELPMALVLAARPVEPGPEGELVDRLASDRAVVVLHPAELSEPAVARVTETVLGRAPEADFARACRRATAGNPFLVGELAAELARQAIAPRDGNADLVGRLSPRGVSRAVRARLHGLPPECFALAQAVAVLGDHVEPPLAAHVAGLVPHEADRAAEQLAGETILAPGPLLGFVHPIVRESVYAELAPGERAHRHAQAADALVEAGAGADRVASHLLLTEPAGMARRVRTLRRAAETARFRGAPEAAATQLRRALREPPPPELEPRITFELGSAELQAGDPHAAVARLSEATRRLPDPRSRALAAAELATALTFTGDAEQAVTALSRAIDGLSDADRELGLMLEAARCSAGYASLAAFRRLGATSPRFDSGVGHPRTAGERMRAAGLALDATLRGTAETGAARARRALDGRLLLDEARLLGNAYLFAPAALLFADAPAEATRALGDVIAWARRHGSMLVFSAASHVRAVAWWRRGALGEVEADARGALEVGIHATPHGALALVEALLARGEVAAAAEAWQEAGLDREGEHGFSAIMRLHTRARLAHALGRPEAALDDLRVCGRLQEAWKVQTPAVADWRTDAVRALAALGRAEDAAAVAHDALEAARAFGSPRVLGNALCAAALLEENDAAIALLHDAVAALERSEARLDHARALAALGVSLRRAGRRAAARPPLRDAIDLAVASGADAIAAYAHEELVAAGARPRRDPVESRSRLTASELRVARMAADGMTNREIAQALFLTEKTVENHLGSCYRKLDIRSRSQLARALPHESGRGAH